MAKKAKPKGEAEPAAEVAEGEAPAGGGRKKLIIIAAAVLLLGGGGGFFFLKKGSGPDPHAAEVKKPVAFVDVSEMIVNLAADQSGDRARYLKLKVALEVKDAKVVSEVQPLMPRVQDILQVFVRELRASDLEGSGGIHRLREELLRRVNLALFPNKVEAVLFKEVVVQ